MDISTELVYDIKRKMLAKYPRFASEVSSARFEFNENLPCHTAATDGKNVYIDPTFWENSTEEDRLFTIAHELLHIKFMHMYRLKDKDGKKRDMELWNIATDAIINANLKRDGLKAKDGYIDRDEALQYTAEEFYEILLKEREENKQNNQGNGQGQNNGQEQNQGNGQQEQGVGGQSEQSQYNASDHSFWGKEFNEQQNSKESEQEHGEGKEEQFDEKSEFEENRQEKIDKYKTRRNQTKRELEKSSGKKTKLGNGNIGRSKQELNWKDLLKREIEKTETVWTQRRSIAENGYAYRLEENDIEDEAETEVMIDISGSVKIDLVRAFLRQLKPLLKESKLRVGCFNEKFWGFQEIKKEKDIDEFSIPEEARGYYAWTEDWDLAVRSFSKNKEINKIVFTDGYQCPGTMPKEDLKKENVIWLVYGNKEFNPCCGKVIIITEKQLEKLEQIDTEKDTLDVR